MVIPTRLNIAKVKRALLRLADTEDAGYELHPECFIKTIPFADAREWQKRLRWMSETHRAADRSLLSFEDESGFQGKVDAKCNRPMSTEREGK
jgi:hypothetical protein